MPWHAETLAFATDILSTIPYNGTIHVFSANNAGLDHIYLDAAAGTWRLEQLDYGCTTLGPEQISSIRFGTGLHVFYRAASMSAGVGIRHAAFDQGTWQFETLDHPNTSARNCVAVESRGQLHVLDHQGSGVMHHARWDGQAWHFELVDSPNGSTGVDAAVVTDVLDNLHVFSRPAGAAPGIRYGGFINGTTWTNFGTMDAGGSNGGFHAVYRQTATTLEIHIFGRPVGGENWPGIRHVWIVETQGEEYAQWDYETLDVGSSSGVSAALVYAGNLHVFGRAPPFQTARVVVPRSTVYLTGAPPHGPGLISRPDPTRAQFGIRHGWFEPGRGWQFETLDPDGSNPGPSIVATEFKPPGAAQPRLDVFTWANESAAPTALRHLYFVP